MSNITLDQSPKGWDAVVEEYERVLEPLTTAFSKEALRLTGVKPGDRILDIAAGTGSLALAAGRAGLQVVAIDFSPQMVKRLRFRLTQQNLANATAKVMDGQALELPMDGQALELPNDVFDAAFSVLGLMFFPNRTKGFAEMFRVLKPGGRAAVVAWASGGFRFSRFLGQAIERAVPNFRNLQAPTGSELQDPERFKSEMEGANFSHVKVHTIKRIWSAPSSEWLWRHARGYSPAVTAIFEKLDQLGPETINATRKVFLETLQGEFGGGPLRLEREVHICVGVK